MEEEEISFLDPSLLEESNSKVKTIARDDTCSLDEGCESCSG
jgi:hypothetical protein